MHYNKGVSSIIYFNYYYRMLFDFYGILKFSLQQQPLNLYYINEYTCTPYIVNKASDF